jgi:hypothetical protein
MTALRLALARQHFALQLRQPRHEIGARKYVDEVALDNLLAGYQALAQSSVERVAPDATGQILLALETGSRSYYGPRSDFGSCRLRLAFAGGCQRSYGSRTAKPRSSCSRASSAVWRSTTVCSCMPS